MYSQETGRVVSKNWWSNRVVAGAWHKGKWGRCIKHRIRAVPPIDVLRHATSFGGLCPRKEKKMGRFEMEGKYNLVCTICCWIHPSLAIYIPSPPILHIHLPTPFPQMTYQVWWTWWGSASQAEMLSPLAVAVPEWLPFYDSGNSSTLHLTVQFWIGLL